MRLLPVLLIVALLVAAWFAQRPAEAFGLGQGPAAQAAVGSTETVTVPGPDGVIDWPMLVDPVKGRYNDPFEALSPAQLRSLGIVLRAREGLKDRTLPAEDAARLRDEMKRHEGLLVAAGIDVDGLLAKREEVFLRKAAASLAGNPELEGKTVRLSGYVIPLFGKGGEDLGGYLVSQAGMCSHIPPPPPNQLIHFGPGHGWESAYVYQPVQLQGRLTRKLLRQKITLLDGQVEMISAFEMDLSGVTVLEDTEPKPQERSFNLFSPLKKSMQRFWGAE